jgi:nucleotide-binding universal stress UspA family protein
LSTDWTLHGAIQQQQPLEHVGGLPDGAGLVVDVLHEGLLQHREVHAAVPGQLLRVQRGRAEGAVGAEVLALDDLEHGQEEAVGLSDRLAGQAALAVQPDQHRHEGRPVTDEIVAKSIERISEHGGIAHAGPPLLAEHLRGAIGQIAKHLVLQWRAVGH